MPEETKITAEESAANAQDGVAGAVEETENRSTDATFNDASAGTDTDAKADGEEADDGAGKQTKEQNSEYARRRREAERQKELRELRERTIIETLGGRNPYTGGEVKDSDDVEEYLAMREIEKAGGDPVGDFAKHQKEKARASRKQAESEAESADWFRRDGEDFAKKHPDVKLDELIADPRFQDYADGKVGKKPLADIYEGYKKLTGGVAQAKAEAQKALDVAAQRAANKKASVGALSTANGAEDGMFFTEEQVDAMSVAECEKHFDKIQKSMSHWKK